MDEGRIRPSDVPSGAEREAENQFWLRFLSRCVRGGNKDAITLCMSEEEYTRLCERVTTTEPTQPSANKGE